MPLQIFTLNIWLPFGLLKWMACRSRLVLGCNLTLRLLCPTAGYPQTSWSAKLWRPEQEDKKTLRQWVLQRQTDRPVKWERETVVGECTWSKIKNKKKPRVCSVCVSIQMHQRLLPQWCLCVCAGCACMWGAQGLAVCLLLVEGASCQRGAQGERGGQVKGGPAADEDWSQRSLTANEWWQQHESHWSTGQSNPKAAT